MQIATDCRMGGVDVSREIVDINLAYLLLAQRMVQQDRAEARFRLGISNELADMLEKMSLAQMMKLADSTFLLCSFRLNEHPGFLEQKEERESVLQQAHISILVAKRAMSLRESGKSS